MNRPLPRGAVWRVLLATSCLTFPAAAHAVTPVAAPPVHQNVDANGVDMATGSFTLSAPDLVIGPSGPQALVYSREQRGSGWRDSATATMAHDSSGKIVVSIGGSSDSFTQTGGTYTAAQGNGATLTYNGALEFAKMRPGPAWGCWRPTPMRPRPAHLAHPRQRHGDKLWLRCGLEP
jgi:hypothetical protein